MKREIIILLVLFAPALSAQTAQEFLDRGIDKHNKQNYAGALVDYNKAISLDRELTAAYFNRGTVYLALEKPREALADFDMTIELDNSFIRAYYSRATIYVQTEQFEEALFDLNMVVELDEKYPNALTLRGQLRCAEDDKEGCCEDFFRARQIGDPSAQRYLDKFCPDQPQKVEYLKLSWPEDENWKIGNRQENEEMIMVELLKEGETFENWSEIGTMQSIKGVTGVPVSKTMNMMYEQSKQSCRNARLTFIEKNENIPYPWIIFTIECSSFKEDDQPESQIWYIVQGKSSLYTNFWATKEKTISPATRRKWVEFFKSGKVLEKGGN